jgi:hypothetical protein
VISLGHCFIFWKGDPDAMGVIEVLLSLENCRNMVQFDLVLDRNFVRVFWDGVLYFLPRAEKSCEGCCALRTSWAVLDCAWETVF